MIWYEIDSKYNLIDIYMEDDGKETHTAMDFDEAKEFFKSLLDSIPKEEEKK